MDLRNIIGFGIAGNFAGHLEQAGELKEFASISSESDKPKGIFPFYIPNSASILSVYPYSDNIQKIPQNEQPQLEPEIVLLCDISYSEGKVVDIKPAYFTVFNDCTLRKEGARKISEKKNWGYASKGISDSWVAVDSFDEAGTLNDYRLASFVERAGILSPYGINTQVNQYSLFNQPLIDWIIDAMNNQEDKGPLEDIYGILKAHNYPEQCIIAIGATAYEQFGEENYLLPGDELTIVAYKSERENIQSYVEQNECPKDSIFLKQLVEY